MNTLAHIITDKAVVSTVVKLRLKLAWRRHNAHFLRDIVADAPDPEGLKHPLESYLPPRRQWMRPGRAARQVLMPDDHYRIALFSAVMKGIHGGETIPIWAIKLKTLIASVKERAVAPEISPLHAPEIRILLKPENREASQNNQTRQYRVLAVYEDLADRLILGFTAKYLSRLVDPLFRDCSCAFRVMPHCSRSSAVKQIADYLKARGGSNVFAAECDIKNFFDSVRHEQVRKLFRSAVDELTHNGAEVDSAAMKIVDQYLDGYDYFTLAEPEGRNLLKGKGDATLSGPEFDDLRKLTPHGVIGRVGIPQGGALSPLMANLVLNEADKAVIGDGMDKDLLYLRYCDDMIIFHTDKKKCQLALDRYMAVLKGLGFVAHTPKQVKRYGVDFYISKSKLPYRVAPVSAAKSASPWVNFLGYQIRYDGELRVRKESLTRHKGKQHDLVMRVIRLLARPRVKLNMFNREIVNTVAFRLVAAGVGKLGRKGVPQGSSSRCWSAAFELLNDNSEATGQMRKLDQHRDRLISKLLGALRTFHPGNVDDTNLSQKQQNPNGGVVELKRPIIGRPLSYCGRLVGDIPSRFPQRDRDASSYGHDY